MTRAIEFPSAVLGRTVPITVIEPRKLDENGRCRTLFALHGMTGCHTDWVNNARLDDYVADLPLVCVLPSVGDSFYMDQEEGAYESFVAKELISYADTHYPTARGTGSRGVLGLSMGGWGALLLALRNPDVFAVAASHSGAVKFNIKSQWSEIEPVNDAGRRVFGEGEIGRQRRREYDLLALAAKFVSPDKNGAKGVYSGPALYLDCGIDDHLIRSNRELLDGFREAGVPYEYHEYPGGHEWVYWDRHVRESVAFVARVLGI